ncbi:hypothetical protein RYA05_05085 [Pseudomonas syringae pv. actinidiae]|nr:hypothetical protein [Pseudomonas syringae pv. actinidiae]
MNNLYLLWHSKNIRVGLSALICFLFGAMALYFILSFTGLLGRHEPKAFVPEELNAFGINAPMVEVKSLNPPLRNLSYALMNDRDGLLIRYVEGYIHTATKIVVNQDILVPDQKIEFMNDSDSDNGVKSLPWNQGFAVGLSYHGGAQVDPLLLDKLAYGILTKWTGESDPIKASTKLLGEKYPEAIRFPMAISHIHQEMLSNIFLVDLEKSSLVDFKSVLLAVKDLPVNQEQLRKLNHAITHNVSYLTNYLSATSKVADEDMTNKKAYYLLNYYLATDYTLYSMITKKMENTIASNSYKEKVRDVRKQQEVEAQNREAAMQARRQRQALATGNASLGGGVAQDTMNEIKQMKEKYQN